MNTLTTTPPLTPTSNNKQKHFSNNINNQSSTFPEPLKVSTTRLDSFSSVSSNVNSTTAFKSDENQFRLLLQKPPPNRDFYPTPQTTPPIENNLSYSPIAKQGRTFATRHTRRLVFKDGSCNVTNANVTQRKKKYLVDIFTTCVDMRWRYLLSLFAGTFIVTWFLFAIAWYSIVASTGGLSAHEDIEDSSEDDVEHTNPCSSTRPKHHDKTLQHDEMKNEKGDKHLIKNDQFSKSSVESQPYTQSTLESSKTQNIEKNLKFQKNMKKSQNKEKERFRRNIFQMPIFQKNNYKSERRTHHHNQNYCAPCIENVHDFTSALLFSIETQHTIGYGFRVITTSCTSAVFLLMFQSCIGVFVQSLMTGLIFAKLSQPKKRAHTIMFSRRAVITKRDGVYCLLFRVGDMRRSHFVGTSIRALLVKDRVTKEGERIPLCQFPLDVKTETSYGDAFVFMVWPVVVVHKIDNTSPLWNLSASQLLQEKFEIIVVMEGIVESTGMSTQVRTSYLPSEILWGHCLAPLLTYQKENGQYKIDYAQFHSIVGMKDMPEESAQENASVLRHKGVSEKEKYSEVSPYFTVPRNKHNNGNSNSHISNVIQRMRGSLRSKRYKKYTIVPTTAPVVSSEKDKNLFFHTDQQHRKSKSKFSTKKLSRSFINSKDNYHSKNNSENDVNSINNSHNNSNINIFNNINCFTTPTIASNNNSLDDEDMYEANATKRRYTISNDHQIKDKTKFVSKRKFHQTNTSLKVNSDEDNRSTPSYIVNSGSDSSNYTKPPLCPHNSCHKNDSKNISVRKISAPNQGEMADLQKVTKTALKLVESGIKSEPHLNENIDVMTYEKDKTSGSNEFYVNKTACCKSQQEINNSTETSFNKTNNNCNKNSNLCVTFCDSITQISPATSECRFFLKDDTSINDEHQSCQSWKLAKNISDNLKTDNQSDEAPETNLIDVNYLKKDTESVTCKKLTNGYIFNHNTVQNLSAFTATQKNDEFY